MRTSHENDIINIKFRTSTHPGGEGAEVSILRKTSENASHNDN